MNNKIFNAIWIVAIVKGRKMNNKIFNAIWIVAIVVFLASLTFIMGVSYNYFSGVQLKQLRTEAELASQGVSIRFYLTTQLMQMRWKIIWNVKK